MKLLLSQIVLRYDIKPDARPRPQNPVSVTQSFLGSWVLYHMLPEVADPTWLSPVVQLCLAPADRVQAVGEAKAVIGTAGG